MRQNVADSSGQGNNGTLAGFTSTTTRPGVIGQAILFSGTEQGINVSTNAINSQVFTYSAWINVPNVSGSSNKDIIRTNNGGTELRVEESHIALNREGTLIIDTTTNGTIQANKWMHVAVTYDTSGNYAIYINGQASKSGTNLQTFTFSTFHIGGENSDALSFVGLLDDVRVYNRALSAAEVAKLYQLSTGTRMGSSLNPANLANGLVGRWTFDGPDMKSNVRDASGSGNNAILEGSTTTVPGIIGQGFNFNGTNSGVRTTSGSTLANIRPLTVAFWMNSSDPTFKFLVGKDSGVGVGWSVQTGGGTPAYIKLTIACATGQGSVDTGSVIPTNQWIFVAYTWDGSCPISSSGTKLYINSAFKNNDDVTTGSGGTTEDSGDRLGIGCQVAHAAGTCFNYYKGKLDDVRIYNRVLSAAEIAQLYQLGTGTHQGSTLTPNNLASGLVGHWTFDGQDMLRNVADTSGQGNTGFLQGFTSTTTATGVMGQALKFNGSSQYVSISSNSSLVPSAISVVAWLKTGNKTTCTSFISKLTGGSLQGFAIRINGSGGCAFVDGNFGFWDGINWITASLGAGKIGDSRWHFLAATDDGSSRALYWDGNSVASDTHTGNLDSTGAALLIGAPDADGGDYYAGSIDDVRIYNHALSASEVRQLYNLGH